MLLSIPNDLQAGEAQKRIANCSNDRSNAVEDGRTPAWKQTRKSDAEPRVRSALPVNIVQRKQQQSICSAVNSSNNPGNTVSAFLTAKKLKQDLWQKLPQPGIGLAGLIKGHKGTDANSDPFEQARLAVVSFL